jgi:hypothetical protein
MSLEVMTVLVAIGLLVALLVGVEPHRRPMRQGTPDDGAIGLGAGRTTRCPVCAELALELVGVTVAGGRELPRVRCTACRSSYVVRGTIGAVGPGASVSSGVPRQRPPAV